MSKPTDPAAVFTSILLVEDEPHLAQTLIVALRQMKLNCTHVSRLSDAREKIKEQQFQLCLLDRMLPDGDGLSLREDLQKNPGNPLILVLSAKGEVDDRIEGLNLGADDYLPKPFSYQELTARITALARRYQPTALFPDQAESSDSQHKIEVWRRAPNELKIFGPKGWVELTKLEYKLVCMFLDNPGTALSREELLRDVWGFQLLPKTRTLDFFMGRIRKNFERNPEKAEHFLTVRGVGYRFEP